MIFAYSLFKRAGIFTLAFSLVWTQASGDGCSDHTKRDASQGPFFENIVPNALAPGFKYNISSNGDITVNIRPGMHDAGLEGPNTASCTTKIYGYCQGDDCDPTWPGMTFEVFIAKPVTVTWNNDIKPGPYIITGADNSNVQDSAGGYPFDDYSEQSVVDETLHWAYSVTCCNETIEANGVPIVTHLHGGHSDSEYDGNPEFFYNHNGTVVGPQYQTTTYRYENNFEPTAIWYHDHALGITRLNTYAGLAGFYILRDGKDTGESGNQLNLPAFPYEVALAIQDRMFKNCGEFLYPAFPGDEAYAEFLEESTFPTDYPNKPSALAEFFGDHMVVNGKVWPKMDVEPRSYRLRLLNGCDSRFLLLEFFAIEDRTELDPSGDPLEFYVVGADQGFKIAGQGPVTPSKRLLVAPGERYDVIINFDGLNGKRVLMWNSGGDEPFKGLGQIGDTSDTTARVMAFDVTVDLTENLQENFDFEKFNNLRGQGLGLLSHAPVRGNVKRTRQVALFEGLDEFGRLQPVLGVIGKARDYQGNFIYWPDKYETIELDDGSTIPGLVGEVEGSVGWHTHPATENPMMNDVEIWEIWNLSADAHPIHLHLVNFEVLSRHNILTDLSEVDIMEQPLFQHTGKIGTGYKAVFGKNCNDNVPSGCYDSIAFNSTEEGYVDVGYPKDLVTALPGQVTRIKAKFHKQGRFVWHCHILSHEDHEMMRVLYVGPEPSQSQNLRH